MGVVPSGDVAARTAGDGERSDDELTVDLTGSASKPSRPKPGEQIDRYLVVSVLGVGGMGTVYAARDPELDRDVAIKLLHHCGRTAAKTRRARLKREAQAMARLSHPNVVTVYEVGEFENQLYVAMELIDGGPLREWMRAKPRSWTDVVDVFLAAGRGLAAAHAQGLVHRDFKPANVIVAHDGRIKVLDFGLARLSDDPHSRPSGDPTADGASVSEHAELPAHGQTRLTEDGTVMGTPAYMAPEQLRGDPCDARADQFAFCVALFEGLYARRPFRGTTLAALARSVRAGDVGRRPDRDVPRTLWRLLKRGLASSPADRFASMDALLRALHRVRRPRRTLPIAGALVGVVGLAAFFIYDDADACVDAAPLQGVWDDARRAEVRDALVGTGTPYAQRTSERVERLLDDYTVRWRTLRQDACRAGRSEDSTALDVRIQCLERRRTSVSALVDVLARADEGTAQRAVASISRLPPLATCSEVATGQGALVPEEPAVAAEVAGLRIRIAALKAQLDAGHGDQTEVEAQLVVDRARELGFGPLIAEALMQRGQVQLEAGEYGPGTATLREAYWAAHEAGAQRTAVRAANRLIYVLAVYIADFEEAHRWARHAEGALARLESGAPLAEAAMRSAIGNLHEKQGEHEAAKEEFERVKAILVAERGPEHIDVATAITNLGNTEFAAGNFNVARQHYAEALALRTELVGPDHPDVAKDLANLSNVASRLGDLETALELNRRAVDVASRALGESHPYVGMMLGNLGTTLERMGRYDDAAEAYERALAACRVAFGDDHPTTGAVVTNLGGIRRMQGRPHEAVELLERGHATLVQSLGDDHPRVARVLISLGAALMTVERYDDAIARLERSREIARTRIGPRSPDVAMATHTLGLVHHAAGRTDEALALHRTAAEIWAKAMGPRSEEVAIALTSLGAGLVDANRADEALSHLETAMAIAAEQSMAPAEVGAAKFALARALSKTGGDATDVRRLLKEARAAFADVGPAAATHVAEVEAFLTAP